jgi:Mrp family chromosome partitioning ATPase
MPGSSRCSWSPRPNATVRPADEPLYTSEQPVSYARDARWLSRRARNVARRPLVLLLLASGAFFIALLVIIAASFGVERVQRARAMPIPPRADTAGLFRALERERARVAGAEAALAEAREDALEERPTTVAIDTFSLAARARRDTLAARSRSLSAAIRRAVDAPLPASFHALAEVPELSSDSALRQFADSVAAIERSRAEIESSNAPDTAFIALTARLAQLGDSMVKRAEARLGSIRSELGALTPEIREVPPANPVDTVPFVVALRQRRDGLAGAESRLASARTHNDSVSAIEARRRSGLSRTASPGTLIASAGLIGLALGFLAALGGEIRRPSIADAREAEAATGVPVLAHVRAEASPAARMRRSADREVPQLIERTTDRYDRLYHRLADAISRLPRLAVLGDHPTVVATVAANVAAAAAHTARATLLLDTDFATQSVAAVMRVNAEPGVADVLARRLHWSSAIAPAVVGRGRTVDVMPAGAMKGGGSLASAASSFAAEVTHIARRYDTVIISAPFSRHGAVSAVAAAVPEAIVCVRTARTSVRVVQRIVEDARRDGARIRGIVIWDHDEPRPMRAHSGRSEVPRSSTGKLAEV